MNLNLAAKRTDFFVKTGNSQFKADARSPSSSDAQTRPGCNHSTFSSSIYPWSNLVILKSSVLFPLFVSAYPLSFSLGLECGGRLATQPISSLRSSNLALQTLSLHPLTFHTRMYMSLMLPALWKRSLKPLQSIFGRFSSKTPNYALKISLAPLSSLSLPAMSDCVSPFSNHRLFISLQFLGLALKP